MGWQHGPWQYHYCNDIRLIKFECYFYAGGHKIILDPPLFFLFTFSRWLTLFFPQKVFGFFYLNVDIDRAWITCEYHCNKSIFVIIFWKINATYGTCKIVGFKPLIKAFFMEFMSTWCSNIARFFQTNWTFNIICCQGDCIFNLYM